LDRSARIGQGALRQRLLRQAATDFRFLLSRNYPRKSALDFVGNRYQLSSAERNILYRAVFTRQVSQARRAKIVRVSDIRGQRLIVDGYNCIITLENAMKGALLVLADDGFVRDTGGIFRRFRQSKQTKEAWSLMARVFRRHGPLCVNILLDAPYARSGQLASSMNRWMSEDRVPGQAKTVQGTEKALASIAGIKISADSIIIDNSDKVFDLAGHIIRYILKRPLIRLDVLSSR